MDTRACRPRDELLIVDCRLSIVSVNLESNVFCQAFVGFLLVLETWISQTDNSIPGFHTDKEYA
jgi:hypothetical protein